MKKNILFSGTILLALVLTGGTFAYTYTGSTSTTIGAVLADAALTTYEPSVNQPSWESILPVNEYDSEYLLPNAPGDDTELPTQYPDSGEHWDKADEIPPDDATTYVSTLSSNHWERDLYNLTDKIYADGYETILNVTVFFRFASDGDHNAHAMAAIKTNGRVYEGPNETVHGPAFVTMSHRWDENPVTGQPWTWPEINDLQAGVTIKGSGRNNAAVLTQVYVVVDYEFVITQGAVPRGDIFDITPHPDYTGDLLVKLYITNTGSLLKAYQYLNMKVYIEHSLEAEKTPDYQVLSIENGVILFNIEGGSADSYTVEVIGGSYRVLSADAYDWTEGWSIAPEFYCEVTQR